MAPTVAAQERAMKFKDVIVQAIEGRLTWWQAADILGVSVRTVRRWRFKYERFGIEGLQDRRRVDRSPHAVRAEEIRRWLGLYRQRYRGYNVRHFHARRRREHGCTWSYTVVRRALQAAGLVKKKRPRGRHFLRREPRACFGELLHIDGSRHRWLTLRPEEWQSLIVVVDDATKRVLYAQLGDGESTQAILTALAAVVRAHGIPQTLDTDRAGWATLTAKAGQPADRTRPTQVGRALQQLGIEHILAYSPQARGRSERVNRTLQDRLVKELHSAGIRTLDRANRYLSACFLPAYNDEFARTPAHPDSGFSPLGTADLEAIFCHEETRTVQRDNTVAFEGVRLQIAKQPGRTTCAGLTVTVRRHLDGIHTITWGPKLLGRYSAQGRALSREPIVHATLGPRGRCSGLMCSGQITAQTRTDPLLSTARASTWRDRRRTEIGIAAPRPGSTLEVLGSCGLRPPIRMEAVMSRRLLLVVACLLSAAPARAQQAGINLSWDDCGTFGVGYKTFACDADSGSWTLVGSFVPPAGVTNLTGMDVVLDLCASSAPWPAWWELKNPGACRRYAATTNIQFAAGSCEDYYRTAEFPTIGFSAFTVGLYGPGTARIKIVSAVALASAGPVTEGVEYYAFNFVITGIHTTGDSACAGCQSEVNIALGEIRLAQPNDGQHENYRLNYPVSSRIVSWQGDPPNPWENCPTPTRSCSWGAIKSLYR